jgi:hypothetical protein
MNMRLYLPLTISGLLLVIAVALADFTIISRGPYTDRLRESEQALMSARQTLAFACGYIYGQRGIISAAKLPMALPKPTDSCPAIRDLAVEGGFTAAAH